VRTQFAGEGTDGPRETAIENRREQNFVKDKASMVADLTDIARVAELGRLAGRLATDGESAFSPNCEASLLCGAVPCQSPITAR